MQLKKFTKQNVKEYFELTLSLNVPFLFVVHNDYKK